MIEIIAHMLISDGQTKENNTENKSLMKKKCFKCECIFRVKYVIFKPLEEKNVTMSKNVNSPFKARGGFGR